MILMDEIEMGRVKGIDRMKRIMNDAEERKYRVWKYLILYLRISTYALGR